MPELPEVEIARRQLSRWTAGDVVREVRVLDAAAIRHKRSTMPRDAHPDGVRALEAAVVGRAADEPMRLGKRLGWTFGEAPRGLQLHLGMTGQWVRRAPADEPPRFAKLGLVLDGRTLWFLDSRRFGCVVPSEDVPRELAEGLGPDAWLNPPNAEELGYLLRGRRPVKVTLLDQARLAGVGNIHAAEALWRSGISPERAGDDLTPAELARLAEELPAQLDEAIRTQDTDEFQYVTQGGENPFSVYGQHRCPRCEGDVAKLAQSGRTTWWCPSCQQ
ncbi:MAG: hypothetical protein EP330_01460 [Deltaproteobacteria bacterium]|nr:MAG: hypothetical protein EP330_01460 [Deltaproteobacteria bacterium]